MMVDFPHPLGPERTIGFNVVLILLTVNVEQSFPTKSADVDALANIGIAGFGNITIYF